MKFLALLFVLLLTVACDSGSDEIKTKSSHEQDNSEKTITLKNSLSYSHTKGVTRSALFTTVNSNFGINQCDMTPFKRIHRDDALGLLEDVYGGYTDPGEVYFFAKEVLEISASSLVLYGQLSVEGQSVKLMHIPYPSDLEEYSISVPDGLVCNTGVTINLTDVLETSATTNKCKPCKACDGKKGQCCSCACISGCGTCFGAGCPKSSCCGGGEIWEFPMGVCGGGTSTWADPTSLDSLILNQSL